MRYLLDLYWSLQSPFYNDASASVTLARPHVDGTHLDYNFKTDKFRKALIGRSPGVRNPHPRILGLRKKLLRSSAQQSRALTWKLLNLA